MSKIIITIIRAYQIIISPFKPNCCRFYPSCSNYCIEAVTQHGILRGLWYGLRRIISCNPYNLGGYDPVPLQNKNKEKK